jgi:hypothetical protein
MTRVDCLCSQSASHGSSRDQRTFTSPIFGSLSLPSASTLNRAFAVNLTAWRRSLRDRNRGRRDPGPLPLARDRGEKFRYAPLRSAWACWSTTADTALSRARSGVPFAAVSPADSSASVM